ncbi:MAG: LysM peptidoglycan-binding domain-containing protein [Treponema sp.]|nr:LysM peptidoglycan-binding domain-containing protein [Candidatus Treponema merdequi]
MKTIGIKLADGTFYPVLTEGTADKKELNLTTVKDDQTTVQVDLYRSESGTMDDAEYVDTLEIKNLKKHPNGEPDIALDVSLDENNELIAELHDPETGKDSSTTVSLVSRTLEQRGETSDVTMATDSDLPADFNSDDDFDLDASLNSNTEQETFESDEDIAFDPNSLQFDSIVEEDSSDKTISENDFNSEISFDEPASDSDVNSEISFDEPASEMSFSDTPAETTSSNAGLDFSDILDEETKEGHAASDSETDSIKKAKVPVLICIICAVICVIAVILTILLISKKKCANNSEPQTKTETVVENSEVKESSKYEAKENEIVVAPAAEVVPEAPKAKAPASKNITYKIKWGDTLWDISKTYYNNPWKYPKIAKYNGIKNPDHIISGTKIIIPAE